MATHALLCEIVIDSTNKWLDAWSTTGGNESVSITEQTYDTIFDVLAAYQVALRALGADWTTATVALDYTISDGRVRISSSANFGVAKWKTGTHGSDNTDTHCGDVLGFSDAADDTGATYHIGDYQHPDGWYAPHGPAADSYDMPVVLGPPPVVVASGLVRRVSNPNTLDDRSMRWEAIYKDKFLPDEASTNEAFADFWRLIARAKPFGYYTDAENETLSGRYAITSPYERLGAAVTRDSAGNAYYSWDMMWHKDPS
jgi:hypothetical protein